MGFASISFLSVFLPATFLACLLCRRSIRWQNACLLVASLFFYAWGDALKVLLLVLSALTNGFLARRIGAAKQQGKSCRPWVWAAVLFNMGLLFGFKYAAFAVQTVNSLLGLVLPSALAPPVPQVALPLGISFFTFQAMSYVLDVYHEKTAPVKSDGTLLLYLCLFPQLIAGPIVKWQSVEKQFAKRSMTTEGVARGLLRLIVGLSKKVLLADSLGRIADLAFSAPEAGLAAPLAWLGAFCYTLQIYLDFSGYSDMAIGMGWMFGFSFPENFRMPLCADSMRSFWRRWHITLTDWFREYLYYPLGGSLHGKARTCWNLLLVFLFTGLWHGANWTFVAWGLLNGLLVVGERLGVLPVQRLPKGLRHVYTVTIVVVGFVVFRAGSLAEAAAYVQGMVRFAPMNALQYSYWMEALAPMGLGMLVCSLPVCFHGRLDAQALLRKSGARIAAYAAALALLVLCYASLVASGYHPFLYFRF